MMKKRYYKIKNPTKVELWIIRTLVLIGVLSLLNFFCFFFQQEYRGFLPLFIPLCVIFLYGACRKVYLWYHYIDISVPKPPKLKNDWKVDILTTYFPGEPYEMVLKTLKAIQNIDYPHTTYLCDESNDFFLKKECEKLGVVHVTRNNRKDAKAGNINNALKQATGDICVILDPDHIPKPHFLASILPHFEDESIGFVQIVQGYYNKYETLVARGAAEQTFQFYGPMMMTMNSYGTVNAIGANCTFRRAALNSIGGHAPGLAEDLHTAMLLHAKGWKSVYVPEFLAKGLVPSDLASYYKQQLKWSRGTFELLYSVYPKIFRRLSTRQKIHYALLPFHYFIGLIYLLSFLIPILSLFLSKMPWTGNIFYFIAMSVPVFMSSFLIRTYIQKWVIEENERGFHMVGGILQIISWWVYFLGIIYTLTRKNIPFLPTPKSEQKVVDFRILIPNLLVGLLSSAAIFYGLRQDLTPFSIVMALFAALNAGFMFFSVYLAVSVTNQNMILRSNLEAQTVNRLAKVKRKFRNVFHSIFNISRPMALPLLLLCVFGTVLSMRTMQKNQWENISHTIPNYRDFRFLGIFHPIAENGLSDIGHVKKIEQQSGMDFNIISFYMAWNENDSTNLESYLKKVKNKGCTPLITWEPWSSTFKLSDSVPDLHNEKRILHYIANGTFDDYIKRTALSLKENGRPVFLRFAHEFDNPAYPWSATGKNTPEDFKAAWKHVHRIFSKTGAHNVKWVWNPWRAEVAMSYYPGPQYVDWLGTTLLNYGNLNPDHKWYSFEELYEPFSKLHETLKKPVILAEFGSLSLGGDRKEWMNRAFKNINKSYDQIKAIVFFNSNYDKNVPPNVKNYKEPYLKWTFDFSQKATLLPDTIQKAIPKFTTKNIEISSKDVIYKRIVLPKLGRGVNYKKSRNWKNNLYIANKDVLQRDFELMKNVGINLINVEHSPVYDYNVLKYAKEKNLKVIYSFWIPKGLNFLTDTDVAIQLKETILNHVRQLRNNDEIVGWNVANTNWSDAGNLYDHLSLGERRQAFLIWVKDLVHRIKEIDPTRFLTIGTTLSTTKKQLEAIRAENIEFDAVGLKVDELNKWGEVKTYLEKTELPFLINGIGTKEYLQIANQINDKTVIIENWQNQKEMRNITFDGLLDFNGRKKLEYGALMKVWSEKTQSNTLPQIAFLRPAIPLVSGMNATYKAVVQRNQKWQYLESGSEYRMLWQLIKTDVFGNGIAIKTIGHGRSTTFEIPQDYSLYRLRLCVSKDGFSVAKTGTLNTPLFYNDL